MTVFPVAYTVDYLCLFACSVPGFRRNVLAH